MENRTRLLCDFLAGITYTDIGDYNIRDIKYKLLDWLACLIAAQNLPSVVNARSVMMEQGGNAHSSIIGSKAKSSAINAAFCNGIAGHALEYDDTNKIAITHPGAPVLAATFAVAESMHCSFETFALAVTVGYEAMIRLGGAVNPEHYQTWHTTGTCGVFAATAAVGVLIGLDGKQLERAFGIASTMASGLVGVFGTDAKLVTVGNAAKNGILAAQLAKKGVTAPKNAFASPNGYAVATNSSTNLSFMIPQFGDKLLIEDAYYKIHASCGHTHSSLDALQYILSYKNYSIDEVKSIQIEVYETAFNLCNNFKNQIDSQAKFSLPYCVAAMMQFKQCTLSEFTPEILNSQEIANWAKKVVIAKNHMYTEVYPKLRLSRVCIELNNGETVEKIVDLPIGKPPYEVIEKKYFSLAEMTITPQLALSIKNKVLSLKPNDKITSVGNLLRKTEENITLKI